MCLFERTNVCLYINVEDYQYFTEYDLLSELTLYLSRW